VSLAGGNTTLRPAEGVQYYWAEEEVGDTEQARAWRPDLSVALNAIDFRGGLPFVYYHQVVSSVECPAAPMTYYQTAKLRADELCSRSSKCQSTTARIRGEPMADPAARCSVELRPVGGHPSGGYEVTILGSGFDEFDANASTVRVLFATEGELPDVNGTLPTGVETTPVRMSAKEIIVIAPAMSLAEGDIRTGRGDPCWNPPCRRTVLSVAINGIDFVEGAVPIEYYFFLDPPRFLNLLDVEFAIYQGALQGCFLVHFLLSWYFRDRYYRLYLRAKHWVKNRTVWRRASYGDVESEPLAKKKKKSSSRAS